MDDTETTNEERYIPLKVLDLVGRILEASDGLTRAAQLPLTPREQEMVAFWTECADNELVTELALAAGFEDGYNAAIKDGAAAARAYLKEQRQIDIYRSQGKPQDIIKVRQFAIN